MSDELIYTLHMTEGRCSTYVEAAPSIFAAFPRGEIRWPDELMMQPELRVEINWSSGGTTFDIERARRFFSAGLALCDTLEARLKEPPPADPLQTEGDSNGYK